MSLKRTTSVDVGDLFLIEVKHQRLATICIAEKSYIGSYEGCALIFIFKPEFSTDHLANDANIADFLIEPIIIPVRYFEKGIFTKSPFKLGISNLYVKHILRMGESINYYDIDGVRITDQSIINSPRTCITRDRLYSITGFQHK